MSEEQMGSLRANSSGSDTMLQNQRKGSRYKNNGMYEQDANGPLQKNEDLNLIN